MQLRVKKLEKTAKLPTRSYERDLGYDLYSVEKHVIMESVIVHTGIAIEFPPGYGGFIKDRSSVSTESKVLVGAGVIDNGYTGEIKVFMINHSPVAYTVYPGDKIAQLVLIPVVNCSILEVEEIRERSERGDKGFGSTDRRYYNGDLGGPS